MTNAIATWDWLSGWRKRIGIAVRRIKSGWGEFDRLAGFPDMQSVRNVRGDEGQVAARHCEFVAHL
jgi:hypothetical protein